MAHDKKMIDELLTRGVAEVVVKESLEEKLASGKQLRVKFGIDPTGNLLHLGHAVALLKLQELQKLGHTIIFLIGDHTAEIGDPSGRSKERVPLTKERIKQNMASYQEQASKLLDMGRVEVRHNSEWYNKLSIMEFAQLTSTVTVSQILQRADFKKRIQSGEDVSAREAFYPILQGYDSVMLKSDIEIGGTDQKFNLLMGRQIQKRYEQEEQDIIMVPLLEGLDGNDKMSKTSNNYIAITEHPKEMYSKIMSVPDSLIWRYFELATRVPSDQIEALKDQVEGGANPRDAKMRLAQEVVTLYHGKEEALKASDQFISVFQKKELPDEIPTISVKGEKWNVVDLLLKSTLVASKGEARRVIDQKGLTINDTLITDQKHEVSIPKKGVILKKGKRHFVKITVS